MALPAIDPAWIALIGTLMGGLGLKVTEHWLGKNKTNSDDARAIREELRSQITSQKEEIKQLEDDVNEWRSKYYDLRDSYVKIQTELTLALQKIKDEAVEADKKLSGIDPSVSADV